MTEHRRSSLANYSNLSIHCRRRNVMGYHEGVVYMRSWE